MKEEDQTDPGILFVGLGNMGRPMARNLASGAGRLFVYDANPETTSATASELGAYGLSDLQDLPTDLGTVILMLPTSRVVESVLTGEAGLLGKLAAGTLIIDMGSSEPASTVAMAAEAADRSIGYIDAPVSGGVAKAKTGELSVMVGGEQDVIARAMAHLQAIGTSIVHVGPVGTGHAAKALNNLLSATNLAAAAEVLSVAGAVGIDPATMVDVINGSTGRSQASEIKYPKHILTGTYDSGFAMDLMLKDLGIAKNLIMTRSIEAPILLTTESLARTAREALATSSPDHTELARYYEDVNGTPFLSNKDSQTEGD